MEFIRKQLSGKILKNYKLTLRLNEVQREILIGVLLGNASFYLRLGKPVYSVKFEQQLSNKFYIDHLYLLFENFVGMVPHKNECPNGHASYWFRTYSHSSFKFYYDIFYKRGSLLVGKRVPFNVHRFLKPRSLAYWYMDDGTFNKTNFNCYLSTQGFIFSDIKELCEALNFLFGIETSIHKDKTFFKIYIRSSSRDKFFSIIEPFVLPMFSYKLH